MKIEGKTLLFGVAVLAGTCSAILVAQTMSTIAYIDSYAVDFSSVRQAKASRVLGVTTGNQWYVSPTGSPNGDGSINNPWDLQSGLCGGSHTVLCKWPNVSETVQIELGGNNQPAVKPGDTVWMLNGTYGTGGNQTYYSAMIGTASQPIYVRQAQGERATLNGKIEVAGNYVWFWGFEIQNNNWYRMVDNCGSFGNSITDGIYFRQGSIGSKMINLVIHDVSNGIADQQEASETESYGNLIYNTGWDNTTHNGNDCRGHGHTIYLQNNSTVPKIIENNIAFNSFAENVQAYGSAPAIWHMHFKGNAIFNGGMPAGRQRVANVTLGAGSQWHDDILFDTNVIYQALDTLYENTGYNDMEPSWSGQQGRDLTMRNNFWIGATPSIYGTIYLKNWQTIDFQNNTMVGALSYASGTLGVWNGSGNKYFNSRPPTGITETGSQIVSSNPTGVNIIIRPNKYEIGRANITVLNWDKKSTVQVDLSQANIPDGTDYEIRDAQNFWGSAVYSGTYRASSPTITLPMGSISAPVSPLLGIPMPRPGTSPLPLPATPPHTSEEFGVFIVMPKGTLPTPPPASNLPSINSLSANPVAITAGQAATLSWSVSNATSATINNGVGPVNVSGTASVSPAATAAYTLTATNSSGSVTQTVTITVSAPQANQKPTGYLDGVKTDGTVFGWAYDPDNTNVPVLVHVYIDKNAGTPGASPLAAVTASDYHGNVGNHAFNFTLPVSYQDGQQHQVWVWAIDLTDTSGASNPQLGGSPVTFTLPAAGSGPGGGGNGGGSSSNTDQPNPSQASATPTGCGEILYNNIQMPCTWPQALAPKFNSSLPSYITVPPATIKITTGRQLFVDDFLLSQVSGLTRNQHQPTMYAGNPILTPNSQGQDSRNSAFPFSDGAWFDPADNLYKIWYFGGSSQNDMSYAYSSDGKNWVKPALNSPSGHQPGSNVVLLLGSRDTATVWMDLKDIPSRKFKAFVSYSNNNLYYLYVYFSPDGISWTGPQAVAPLTLSDRSTAFYNPFRGVWVNSARNFADFTDTGTHVKRARFYSESKDLQTWTPADPATTYWTGNDQRDPAYPGLATTPELYNLDATPYESLMVGLFSWYYPYNPDLVEVGVGFSRDGFNWVRPTRGGGPGNAFLPATNLPNTWNGYNTQSAGGGFLTVGDNLYFYFSGRNAQHNSESNITTMRQTGLATLRRDGFYSLDAGAAEGTLTTRPVTFNGDHFFVNVSDPNGRLQVEVLDQSGNVISGFSKAESQVVSADKTAQEITWNGNTLASLAGRTLKFKFYLTNGALYSFWITPSATGASYGYVAAGGPGFNSDIDTIGSATAAQTGVAAPVFSPNGGTYSGSSVTVQIASATNGAVIRYTLDGSTPTANSIQYTGPITLSNSATLKAIAFSGSTSSNITLGIYTILADTTPPSRGFGSPAGTLSYGTSQATLQLKTGEPASCKYSTTANTSYGSMANVLTASGDSLTHTASVSVSNGGLYNYYVRCTDNNGNANTDDFTVNFSVASNSSFVPFSQYLEGESGTLTGAMAKASDSNASGNSYIYDPVDNSEAPGNDSASYSFTVPNTGTYYVWSRVLSIDAGTDSFYVSVDGGNKDVFDTAEQIWSTAWQWTRVNGRNSINGVGGHVKDIDPRPFTVSAGNHTLTFYGRDPNTKLDQILITNDINFRPSGTGTVTPPSGDTSLPTVSITSPAASQTISGSVTASASAADNVGVMGVQFKVDGINLGGEDTASPYAITIDTLALTNGSHAIAAVARDAAGNAATATVTVTVNNPVSDTTAPVISNITSQTTSNSATISWTTDENSDSQIEYGANLNYGSASALNSTRVTSHSATLSNLAAGTTYHYRAKSRDGAGNLAVSPDQTLTTSAVVVVDQTPPTRVNNSTTSQYPSNTTQASLSITTNETATCKYGTTAGVSFGSMASQFSQTGSTNHSASVGGLSSGNVYSYYVRCQDTAGNANGDDLVISFSIAAVSPPPAPVVSAPNISPAAGTYTSNVSVTLSSSASGANIYYTTNDATPTTGSALYTGPFTLSANATVKAIAVSSGTASAVSSSSYVVQIPATPPASGTPVAPVGSWSFDSDAVNGSTVSDGSGSGISGTIINGVAPISGKINQGLTFNGVDGYIALATNSILGLRNDMTLGAWIKTTNSSRSEVIVSKYDASGDEQGYIFKVAATGKLDVRFGGANIAGSREVLDTGRAVNDGVWHHVAAVITLGQSVKFYVDGSLNSEVAAMTAAWDTQSLYSKIGVSSWLPFGSYFTGAMDEVRVYNKALTAAEVAALYNAIPSTPPSPPVTVSTPIISPVAGAYTGSVSISISPVSGASVYYTTNGSTPSSGSALYTGSFTLTANATVKAVAISNGISSSIVTASYNVTPNIIPTAPVLSIASPKSGDSVSGSTVSIAYGKSGTMTAVNKIKWQIDTLTAMDDTAMNGSFQLTNVTAGSHILKGYFADAAGAKVGVDVTVAFTTSIPPVTPPPVTTVTKHIKLSVEGSSKLNFNGKLILFNQGTKVQAGEIDTTTDATGGKDVPLPAGIPNKIDIRISVPGYLSKIIANVDTTQPGDLDFGQLVAGDLNGDGIINSIDYSLLAAKYGQNYDLADFNKNGIVNNADTSILINNWNRQGQ